MPCPMERETELSESYESTTKSDGIWIILQTKHKFPLEEFPIPAHEMIDLKRYMVLSIQWTRGCPFTCEFCDIPELYGRNPRVKSPKRLIAELDTSVKQH
jgi:hopanoid C-2 methylase